MDKEDLIKKWLNNDLSEAEAKSFQDLEDAKLYEEIIQEGQRFKGETRAKVQSFETIEPKLFTKKPDSINWIKIVSKIAAVFVIGIGLLALWNLEKTSAINTEYAQNETITLPDNSVVHLNELSQLEYSTSNWDDKRLLELKGEAFFDVEKGKRFVVNTQFGNVSVLGTEFNVLSRDSIFKVSCYEGLVQVYYESNQIKLPAGTEFVLKHGKGQKNPIRVAKPYWLKSMSVFENASIDNVIKEIEKQFDIIVIKAYDPENLMFTGAFEHNNLENALKSITQPLNLTYEISNNNEVTIRNVKN